MADTGDVVGGTIAGAVIGIMIGATIGFVAMSKHYNERVKTDAALMVVTGQIPTMSLDSILAKYQLSWIFVNGSNAADSILAGDSGKVK